MTRVASLFLPRLATERLRRNERSPALPERGAGRLPVDGDPGTCSVPRGGHWRPGARWADRTRAGVDAEVASLPRPPRPPGRPSAREVWTVPMLERALADDPVDTLRKYHLVFAKGPGMAWDKADSFNARRGLATISAEEWAVANLSVPERSKSGIRR